MVNRNAGIALFKTIIASFLFLCIVIGLSIVFIRKHTPAASVPTPTLQANALTPTQPVQIKTYTNMKYHFAISYPSTWTVKEYPDTQSGASFYRGDSSNPENMVASISVMSKVGNQVTVPFGTYVKTAASQEIQGYQKLQTISPITTTSGVTGYETTWMVQPPPMMGGSTSPARAAQVSQPITYFPMPDGKTSSTIQVTLANKDYLSDYNTMLQSFTFVK